MALRAISPEVRQLLDGGMNINMLARIFGLKISVTKLKLEGLRPLAKKDGEDVWRVRDAAPFLSDLPPNVVEQVIRMNHMDLPPMLRKEYWMGQQSMLKVKEAEGELWQTDALIEYVGSAFKDIRMSILLAGDALERTTTLTDRQREEVKGILDGLLRDIQERVHENFTKRRRDIKGKPGTPNNAQTRSSIAEQVADL